MSIVFQEGNRCNRIDIKKLKPYEDSHQEPTDAEYVYACNVVRDKLRPYFHSRTFSNNFIKQLFQYRINTCESLMHNVTEFFSIMLRKNISFVYSPDKGLSIWPMELGFFRDKYIEDTFKNMEYFYFADYIHETTTFVRFHFKWRFDKIFSIKTFISNCIHDMLYFAYLEGRFHLMRDIIITSLNMIMFSLKV